MSVSFLDEEPESCANGTENNILQNEGRSYLCVYIVESFNIVWKDSEQRVNQSADIQCPECNFVWVWCGNWIVQGDHVVQVSGYCAWLGGRGSFHCSCFSFSLIHCCCIICLRMALWHLCCTSGRRTIKLSVCAILDLLLTLKNILTPV